MRDEGVVSTLVVALLALAGLLCLAVADAANVVVSRSRAQSAADAAALAAAVAQWPFVGRDEEPTDAARRTAQDNGATLEHCECPLRGGTATVSVWIPTRIRLLGVAPLRVHAHATSTLDIGGVFRAP